MVWKFFAKENSKKAIAPIDANTTIMKLRQTIEQQEKREQHLEAMMLKLTQVAKVKMANGDRKGALSAMNQRKLYQGERDRIDNVKLTLETQAIKLEGASQNVHTFSAMKSGNIAMASIRKSIGIDRVDEMMDDIREEMELHREVDTALAQSIDPFLGDDVDLLAELDALESECTRPSSAWSNYAIPSTPPKRPETSAGNHKSRVGLFG